MGHHGNSIISFGEPVIDGAGGWIEVGRTTLGAPADVITVSGIPNRRYYQLLVHTLGTGGNTQARLRLNNDSGMSYAERFSINGVADNTSVNGDDLTGFNTIEADDEKFSVGYVANLSVKEKLILGGTVSGDNDGSGLAPNRTEVAAKWANTSSSINRFDWSNEAAGSFDTGSEVVILAWSPTDTHATNFWEELATVTSGGSVNDFATSTFTAKKYMWIQGFFKAEGGNLVPSIRVGNTTIDTGTNYSIRFSTNGGGDGVLTSVIQIETAGTFVLSGDTNFFSCFVINVAAQEKLFTVHAVNSEPSGASSAPTRIEVAGKWDDTTNQINIVGAHDVSGSGTFGAESFITVWGAD